jgi:hypothetical protein
LLDTLRCVGGISATVSDAVCNSIAHGDSPCV